MLNLCVTAVDIVIWVTCEFSESWIHVCGEIETVFGFLYLFWYLKAPD